MNKTTIGPAQSRKLFSRIPKTVNPGLYGIRWTTRPPTGGSNVASELKALRRWRSLMLRSSRNYNLPSPPSELGLEVSLEVHSPTPWVGFAPPYQR